MEMNRPVCRSDSMGANVLLLKGHKIYRQSVRSPAQALMECGACLDTAIAAPASMDILLLSFLVQVIDFAVLCRHLTTALRRSKQSPPWSSCLGTERQGLREELSNSE